MSDEYEYDVFISFNQKDANEVLKIYQKLTGFGLNVFWSEERLGQTTNFTLDIQTALTGSRHFILYWSKNAAESEWVETEWTAFFNSCYLKDKKNRRMHVLVDKSCDPPDIPKLLACIQQSKSEDQLIMDVVKNVFISKEEKKVELQEQLIQEKRKVEEARDYYRHARFWKPFANKKDIHIFTCARDIPQDRNNTRGQGGRTNIDKWDYRAVLDITHFFASNYPSTKVTIEDPMSKLQGVDLTEVGRLAAHINAKSRMLADKDCIIIGSPDVSDFAEIVLAEIHGIPPYIERREKKRGFVIIKEQKNTRSSFYWKKEDQDQEGIAQILDNDGPEYFPHMIGGVGGGKSSKTFGILIVANNPFCQPNIRKKIIIMSGFSGVATNAIAKILTDEIYLKEFFKLDQAYVNTDRNIEALIGVEYVVDKNSEERDTRQIAKSENAVTFERLVEI